MKWTLFHLQKKTSSGKLFTHIHIDNFDIVRESVTKFLGIFIDENLTWIYQIEHICNKVSKSIGIMYKSLKSRNILRKSIGIMYKSIIFLA